MGIQNVGFLVQRDLYHADGTDEVSLTAKSSVSVGIAYDDTHYRAAGYDDYGYAEVPVNVYFKVEPKLDLSAGFRYRDNTVGGNGIDSSDYFYNVGARGEFTPSLTGQFNVGYQRAVLDNGTKYDGVGADSNFTYAADPKTTITLGVDNDFSYSALGQAFRDLAITLGFTSAISDQWSVNAQAGYTYYSYITSTQRDDFYTARAGVSYMISRNVTVSASYTYAQDSSNITLDSFKDNLFSISGALRF